VEFWNQPNAEYQGQGSAAAVPLWRTRVFMARDRLNGEVHILRINNDKLWNVVDREEGDSVRQAIPPTLKLLCIQVLVEHYPSIPPWRVLTLETSIGSDRHYEQQQQQQQQQAEQQQDNKQTTTISSSSSSSSTTTTTLQQQQQPSPHEQQLSQVICTIPRGLGSELLDAVCRNLIYNGKHSSFNAFALCDFERIDLHTCAPPLDSSMRRMSLVKQAQLVDALVPELYAIGPTLTELNLANTNITSRGLKAITSFTPQLLSLDISHCQSYFQWDFLLALEQLHSLTLAKVVGNAQLWSRLCGLSQHLSELNLNEAQIQRNEVIAYVPRLSNLTLLDIRQHATRGHFRMDDEIVIAISKLSRLQTLRMVASDSVTVGGLAHLAQLPTLTALDVSHLVGEAKHAVLEQLCGTLTMLSLRFCQIQEESMNSICKLTALSTLVLSDNYVSGTCLERLGSLPALAALDVSNNDIGFDRSSDHESLRSLTSLVSLNINNNPLVSSRQWLNGLNATTHLSNLRLLTRLERLDMQGYDGGVEDMGLYHLRTMSHLTALGIRSNSISDNGLESLVRALPRLLHLDIGDNEMSSDVAKILAQHATQLVSISASASALSDSALFYLTQLPKLRTIDMRNTRITEEAIQLMTDRFPYIRLIT
jgi:hypothetical protein